MDQIFYQRVYKQKLVPVVREAVEDDDWSNDSVDRKLMAANKVARLFRAKQLLRKYRARMFKQFHSHDFQMINVYFCSSNEPSEWSQRCCVVTFVFPVMYFKY